MQPYYDDGQNQIWQGDCREMLPHLPTVDLVLTDPPYGIGLANHGVANQRRRSCSWTVLGDDSQAVGNAVLETCTERGWPILAFCSPLSPWAGNWRQALVWDKGPAVGGGGDPATCWKQTWEMLLVRGTGRLQGARDSAVLRYWVTPSLFEDHPCAKPVPLLRYLIDKTTAPNAVVLDPFMGSGSVVRAAMDCGRRAIGIETEERYCAIAVERLRQQVLPLDLGA